MLELVLLGTGGKLMEAILPDGGSGNGRVGFCVYSSGGGKVVSEVRRRSVEQSDFRLMRPI